MILRRLLGIKRVNLQELILTTPDLGDSLKPIQSSSIYKARCNSSILLDMYYRRRQVEDSVLELI